MAVGIASVLVSVLVLALTYMVLTWAVKRYRFASVVNKIPGPTAYPVLGNALDVVMIPRSGFMDFIDMRAREYAPIFRTWNGFLAEVHVTSPDFAEIVLSGMKHIEKGMVYNFLHPWLGEGLLTSKGSKWQIHRKMITPTFHFKILESFFPVFVEKGQILIKRLQEKVATSPAGKEFNIYPFITRCTLDIICETAMGVQLNAQEDTESEYVNAVIDISELTMVRATRPWLHKKFIFDKTQTGKNYNRCLQTLHGFTEKVIAERKQEASKFSKTQTTIPEDEMILGSKKRLAFLDLLLETMVDGNVLTDKEIREEVDTFMFEGHDTTTVGISWALILLGAHPHIQEKVFEELDGIFHGSDRPVTMRDIQEMKYLERVIKETLRLYPSVPFILRNLDEDTKFGQYTVPAGVMLNVHIFHVHRDEKHYPNPDVFDPDNFLPERIQGRHPYAYIPFSAGPRNCIGQKFALLEEKTLLAMILRSFQVRSFEKPEKVTRLNELVLRPESGAVVVLMPR